MVLRRSGCDGEGNNFCKGDESNCFVIVILVYSSWGSERGGYGGGDSGGVGVVVGMIKIKAL